MKTLEDLLTSALTGDQTDTTVSTKIPDLPSFTGTEPVSSAPVAPYPGKPAVAKTPQQIKLDQEAAAHPGPGTQTFGANSAWGDPGTLEAYFQSKGVGLDEVPYWQQKWQQWGKADPAFFFKRLEQADSLGGTNPNPEQGGQPGGGTEFSDPWGSTLEGLVQKYLGALDDKSKLAQQRGGELSKLFTDRATELDAPAYTTGDEALIRGKAFDKLEIRRQQTIKNAQEKVYARGFEPTSGILAGDVRDINRNFEGERTGIESDLLQQSLAETQARKNAAVQLRALAKQAENGADATTLQYLASQLDAVKSPLDLINQRFLQAIQASNLGGDPNGGISAILSILGAGQNNAVLEGQNNANNLNGLGTLLSLLQGALS